MKYFTDEELACKCGKCDTKMSPELITQLIALREHAAFPFIITSAARCNEYNKKVGGYPKSRHLKGKAVDIKVNSNRTYELLGLLKRYGFNGVGVSQKGDFSKRFIHVDMRDSTAVWSY